MTSIITIYYVSVFFSHKTVAKIAGQPTFKTLKQIQKQIEENVATVTSSLGGGLHRHLGLVIPTSEYSNILGSQFIIPVHPGKLTIPQNSALHDAIRLCEEHNEKLKHFHETIAVKIR